VSTVRTLLAVNVYVAVLLSAVAWVGRAKGQDRGVINNALLVGLGVSLVWALLSIIMTRHGPWRWLLPCLFLSLAPLSVALWHTVLLAYAVLFYFTSSSDFTRFAGHIELIIWLALPVVAGTWWFLFLFLASRCLPLRCASCDRVGMIRTVRSHPGQNGTTRYQYYWCLFCGCRWKRGLSRSAAWENASGPAEE
jgi:hypothetical protein